jgi:hypothetical protein
LVQIKLVDLVCRQIEIVLVLTIEPYRELAFADGEVAFGFDNSVENLCEFSGFVTDIHELLVFLPTAFLVTDSTSRLPFRIFTPCVVNDYLWQHESRLFFVVGGFLTVINNIRYLCNN